MRYVLIEHEVNYANSQTREDEYTNRRVVGASRDGESKEDFVIRQKEKIGDYTIGTPEEALSILESDENVVYADVEVIDVAFVTLHGSDIISLFVLHEVED